ncbi:MAG: ferrous iron transport protein A [Clostridia bacterium]|nr:ferrous iron transport protein A [Clostridia bacterium]
MMPLVFAPEGEELVIKKIGGSADVRQHLADIGFNVGSTVAIITTMAGNVIVKVKEARIAISREMAQKIMV